jgi:anaerobic selenocysteine-containing dehydrogenase
VTSSTRRCRSRAGDCQPSFETAHYINGFAYRDGKFRFKPDWEKVPYAKDGMMGPWREMPTLPDHWEATEEVDEAYPFRLATSPSRSYLNSSFTETPGSQKREGEPALLMHPDDIAAHGFAEGADVLVGSPRGETVLAIKAFAGVRRGVVIAEGIHPNKAHKGGKGINTLTDGAQVAPFGGAPFHDNKVWVRAA